MLTPNSGTSPYITPAQFLLIRDQSVIASMVLDGLNLNSPLDTYNQLLVEPLVTEVLVEASGTLEAYTLRGERYSTVDLAATNGNSQGYMRTLLASIAVEYLRRKRCATWPVLTDYTEAMEELERLASGKMIFGFAEVEAAGTAQTANTSPQQIASLHLLTGRASRIYPNRCGGWGGGGLNGGC